MEMCSYRFPVLVVAIAVVLLCFFLHAKRKRAAHDVTTPTTQDGNASSVLHTISLPEDQADEDRRYDRAPPRYSTMDPPPPYSLVREPSPQSASVTGSQI